MSTRHEYSRQALTYDTTRAASPSVLAPLLEALGPVRGRLLDVGGGTGNYAAALRERGFDPTVVDLNEGMLERAAQKGLPTAVGDATALPFADASFDAVMLVSMLHHVPEWRDALAEARRVVVPGGPVVVMGFAREHIERATWLRDYFPSTERWMTEQHVSLAELRQELPGARATPVRFEDIDDMSVAALQRRPELLLDEDLRRQTSFFERLSDTAPDELREGTERLRADLSAGVDPREWTEAAREELGDAFVLGWTRPG
ncbi:MAG: Methyltransferase type 11 [Solirubrobacteraceae bacterium]|nr:Methyltransferase type 11 [Solirubrobacteraceae bacterium]